MTPACPGFCDIGALRSALTLVTIALNVYLFVKIPKGFFPQQDTGRLTGITRAAQDISFQAMQKKLTEVVGIIKSDPAIDNVLGFTGGGGGGATTNTARLFIALKPLGERKLSADQVIARLRGRLASVPGAPTFLQAVQDLRVGGQVSAAQYQYTLQGDNVGELDAWGPRSPSASRRCRSWLMSTAISKTRDASPHW